MPNNMANQHRKMPERKATATKTKWDHFMFRDYRSRDQNSDSSNNSSPPQQSTQSPKVIQDSKASPKSPIRSTSRSDIGVSIRRRRNAKMRFSFILDHEESSTNVNDDAEALTPRASFHSPTISTEDDASIAPTSPSPCPSGIDEPPVSASGQCGNATVKVKARTTSPAQRRSPGLRDSVYFDAVEAQDTPNIGLRVSGRCNGRRSSFTLATLSEEDEIPSDRKQRNITSQKTVHSESDTEEITESESEESGIVLRETHSAAINSRRNKERQLPCTRATRADTVRLKADALELMRYEESEDIYSDLLTRLERMVAQEDKAAAQEDRLELSVPELTLRLRDFLCQIREGRVVTGESRRFVDHETEWAEWIHEAARSGVMHVKTAGCRCRAEWKV